MDSGGGDLDGAVVVDGAGGCVGGGGFGGGCGGVGVDAEGGAAVGMSGIGAIGGVGRAWPEGAGGATGVDLFGPMSMPGMLIDMFCMADMRLVSESIRNCADVTTRSPSTRPETTE